MISRTLLFCLIFISACGGDHDLDDDWRADSDPIVGGRRDTRHSAVGQIGQWDDDGVAWICTGTLIDSDTVLTAAHCLYGDEGERLSASAFVFQDRTGAIDVASLATNRYLPGSNGAWNDIAVLRLATESNVRPIPISTDPPLEGGPAMVVGFGVTRATGPHTGVGAGTKRVGNIVLDQVDPKELLYFAEPTGACYGDSGGPILQRVDGRTVVVGVTSRGTEVDCSGVDIATRVDAYSAWIRQVASR